MRPFGFQLNPDHSLSQGLQLAMLGEGVGTFIARDNSRRGNNGTLTNMDPKTDWLIDPERGWVLDFDGANDSLLLPSTLTGATEFTTSGWVNARGAFNVDVVWEHSANFNGSDGSFLVYYNGANLYLSRKTAPGYNGGNRARPAGAGWHHLVVTWSEVAALNISARIWCDGVEQVITNVTHTAATIGVQVPSQPLYMASRATTSLYLNCQLADHVAYNRALTLSEIQLLASPDPLYHDASGRPWIMTGRRPFPMRPPAAGAIMNQLQGANLGADLFDGALIG